VTYSSLLLLKRDTFQTTEEIQAVTAAVLKSWRGIIPGRASTIEKKTGLFIAVEWNYFERKFYSPQYNFIRLSQLEHLLNLIIRHVISKTTSISMYVTFYCT
jgi:hypothetical protein